MRIFVAIATLALAGLSLAQDLTLKDVLAGAGPKTKIAAKDLPETFRPVRVSAGENDPFSAMMPYMALGVMGRNASQSGLAGALLSSWTDGSIVNVEGQRFLVTYRLSADFAALSGANTLSSAIPSELSLNLVRVDSIKTLAPDPSLTKQSLLQALALGQTTADVVLMEGAAVATAAPPQSGQEKAATINNMKQVALGALMYCSDYDDVYPYVQNTATVREVTAPYLKNNDVWKTFNPRGGRILFNTAIGGVNAVEIEAPAEMPMFYDELAWPDGSRVVAYADGHVKSVSSSGWLEVEKQLKKRYKRKGKPLPAVKG